MSEITDATAYEIGSGAMGVDFVQSGTVLCAPGQGPVVAIELIIDKFAAAQLADILSREHQQISRNLPRLGDGQAVFASQSGETKALITYVHVSFQATARMTTKDFDALWLAHAQAQDAMNERALENAF